MLRKQGKPYFTLSGQLTLRSRTVWSGNRRLFVMNNAIKSRRNYKAKFDQLGVKAHVVGGREGRLVPPPRRKQG